MQVNERFIKIGKVPVSTSVPLGTSTFITIPGEEFNYQFTCVKVEQKDLQDGTYDEIYILKHSP